MMTRKALFVFREMGTGGAQKIEAFVANTLLHNGYEVVAINMSEKKMTVSLDDNIKVEKCNYDKILKHNKLTKAMLKFGYLIELRSKILKYRPDVVISFLNDVVRITVLALAGTKIKIVGSERGDPFIISNQMFQKYRRAYCKCKAVAFQLPKVKEKYDLPKNINQAVIPNPCIPRKHSFSFNASRNTKKIISAGRICEQKRFDVLIDAFDEVYRQHQDYSLIIYGDGPMRDSLQRKAQSLNSGKAILFAGNKEDVFDEANDAEIFVLSSDYEGIPNVIIEALASGIPCVATNCSPGGAEFLLKNGAIGLLSPCGDSHLLAKNINKYIDNPELRYQMAENGASVFDDYNESDISQMWIDLLENAIE